MLPNTLHVQRMSASYYLTAMFDNCVPWQQPNDCSMTRPFLSVCEGVACEPMYGLVYQQSLWTLQVVDNKRTKVPYNPVLHREEVSIHVCKFFHLHTIDSRGHYQNHINLIYAVSMMSHDHNYFRTRSVVNKVHPQRILQSRPQTPPSHGYLVQRGDVMSTSIRFRTASDEKLGGAWERGYIYVYV